MSEAHTIAELIKQRSAALGFALCGICEARPSDRGDFLWGWLDAGKHGEMKWLAENADVRLDPRKLVEGAKSVIVVADELPRMSDVADSDSSDIQHPASHIGRIARYAQFTDYHKVMKKRLHRMCDALAAQFADHHFRGCVDTAPLMEREHAVRAGLGWIGKHTLLLNRDRGSHLMLGAIVTTLAIEPYSPTSGGDHCGTCTRCIDACPTQCITPYSVDAARCISYLTIEHRSAIDASFHEAMGDWLFGCDVCQDVCPFVRKADARAPSPFQGEGRGEGKAPASANRANDRRAVGHVSPSPNPSLKGRGDDHAPYRRLHGSFDLLTVLNWTEADRRTAFTGSAMKRAKLDMIRRNAIIVAGHALAERDSPALRRRVEQMAVDTDESEMVRQTARQVLPQRDDSLDET